MTDCRLRAFATLAVALFVSGCLDHAVTLATGVYDCSRIQGTLEGVLVGDSSGISVFSTLSSNHTTALMWPIGYTGVAHSGGEIDVLNAAGVRVATTGKTYRVDYGATSGDSRLFPVGEVVAT